MQRLTLIVALVCACNSESPPEDGRSSCNDADCEDGLVCSSVSGECEIPAPPGSAGGLCLALAGTCVGDRLICNTAQNYCYDPESPCLGFACGGAERGQCAVFEGQPSCTCETGYENETFALYCCPVDGVCD